MQFISSTNNSGNVSQFLLRLLSLLILMLVGNMVFLGLSAFISIAVWDYNFFENPAMLTSFSNAEMLPIIKLFQALQTIGLFLIPGIVWAWFYTKPVHKSLMIGNSVRLEVVFAMLLLIIVAIPMINGLADINGALVFPDWLKELEQSFRSTENRAEHFMVALLKTDNVGIMLVNMFIVAVLPAVAEEVFFRGVLQNELERTFKNPIAAIVITAIIFSAFHFQFFTFLPRFILGMMMGLVYFWSRNIWVPIVLHFFNNALTVITWFWFSPEVINSSLDTVGTLNHYWVLSLLSTALVITVLYFTRWYFTKLHHSLH